MYKKIVILFILSILISCSDKNEEVKKKQKVQTMTQNTTIGAGNAALTIFNPWIRPSAMDRNSALFFKVINASALPDTLLSAESEIAKLVEVHETYKKGEDMMGMRRVDFVEIPAQDTMLFKPKSFHVMLISLKENLSIGDTVSVVLNFATAGKISFQAPIQDMPNEIGN